jgi:hypothetical protein
LLARQSPSSSGDHSARPPQHPPRRHKR